MALVPMEQSAPLGQLSWAADEGSNDCKSQLEFTRIYYPVVIDVCIGACDHSIARLSDSIP